MLDAYEGMEKGDSAGCGVSIASYACGAKQQGRAEINSLPTLQSGASNEKQQTSASAV